MRLGCRSSPNTEKLGPPSQPTIRRTLTRIDADALDRLVGEFLSRAGFYEAVATRSGLGAFPPRYTENKKGHGRIERRTIQLTAKVHGSWFSYAAQGFRIERTTRDRKGRRQHEVAYGITRLALDRASEARVLGLARGHWTIEALHHIRDVTYNEDRCRIPTSNGPRAMATLRNLAIGLLRLYQPGTVARANRVLVMNPHRLLALIGA